jgi:hypothetical protein
MENIETKGGYEGRNAIYRTIEKGKKYMPFNNLAANAAAMAGAGTAAVVAPAMVAGGLAAYGTGKAVSSPLVRKGIGKLLTGTGKTIKPK